MQNVYSNVGNQPVKIATILTDG